MRNFRRVQMKLSALRCLDVSPGVFWFRLLCEKTNNVVSRGKQSCFFQVYHLSRNSHRASFDQGLCFHQMTLSNPSLETFPSLDTKYILLSIVYSQSITTKPIKLGASTFEPNPMATLFFFLSVN